jgi:hypothetical protein
MQKHTEKYGIFGGARGERFRCWFFDDKKTGVPEALLREVHWDRFPWPFFNARQHRRARHLKFSLKRLRQPR